MIGRPYNIHLFFLLQFLFAATVVAQPSEQLVKVLVVPDHDDWTYNLGDSVTFHVSVLQHGHPVSNVSARFEVRPEKMENRMEGDLDLTEGSVSINAGTMNEPGFLRCWVYAEVDGRKYQGYATAAFAPEEIKPTTTMPTDFVAFWDSALAGARSLPLDAKMTHIPDLSSIDVNVYEVSFQNDRPGSRMYGILSVPAAPGKYPALLQVPGAGIRPYSADVTTARKGIISLVIGIHGIPVTLDPEVYFNLASGALGGYPAFNLDDKDAYYYKRVFVGCVRAIDFLFSLPEFDGERIGVHGGSQGGALAIVTAALDPRIDVLASTYPALCDHTGYLNGRAGGWPHLFAQQSKPSEQLSEKIEASRYYDVVNFARLVQAKGFYTWGFNDTVCPPTSMFSAYNVITAPRELMIVPETAHWTYPEQRNRTMEWLIENLNP